MVRTLAPGGAMSGVPGRGFRGRWWLICRDGDCRLETLTASRNGERLMPVLCFREEAEMFLELDGLASDGWRVRESRAGELASMLCDPVACAHGRVGGVALDPLPVTVDGGMVMDLARVDRKDFLRRLLGESREPRSVRR